MGSIAIFHVSAFRIKPWPKDLFGLQFSERRLQPKPPATLEGKKIQVMEGVEMLWAVQKLSDLCCCLVQHWAGVGCPQFGSATLG